MGAKLKIIVSFAILILCFSGAHAQDHYDSSGFWNILSPAPGSSVDDGDIYIAVQLEKGEKLKKSKVAIWLDDYLITYQTRITDKRITLIYSHHLAPGKHHIRVNARTEDDGVLVPLNWDFFVGEDKSVQKINEKNKVEVVKEKVNPWALTANISANSRNNFIDGTGKDLTQEAKLNNTQYGFQEVSFDIIPSYKRISFPISGFFTTTEDKYLQPRNRYRAGISTDYFEAFYGDHFTMYDNLIMYGNRIHGTQASITINNVKVSGVYGDFLKPIDGKIARLTPYAQYVPYGLRSDSTYIEEGTYRQKVAAGRIDIGRVEDGSTFGVTFQRAWDDTNSIKYGGSPRQNVVVGSDFTMISKNRVFSLNVGSAFSLTTDNYRIRAIRKGEADTFLKTRLPIDPEAFKPLIIINQTTSLQGLPNGSTFTWYVKPQVKYKTNTLNLEAKEVGPTYTSFGNPYMRKDIREYSANDNLILFNNKVNLQANYVYNHNNILKNSIYTTYNQFLMGIISFFPSEKLPSLSLGITYNQMSLVIDSSKTVFNNDNNLIYNGSLNYNFSVLGIYNMINTSYIYTQRQSLMYPDNASVSNIYSASISQQYSIPISLSFAFSHYSTVSNNAAMTQKINTYNSSFSYNINKIQAALSINYMLSQSLPTEFTPAGARHVGSLGYRMRFLKNFNFSVDGGLSYYQHDKLEGQPATDYDNKFVNATLSFVY